MNKLLLFLVFIGCTIASFGQINMTDLKNRSSKLSVKHLNLISQQEEMLDLTNLMQINEKFVPGFHGNIQTYDFNENKLKSLDLLETINQNPIFPENAILHTWNKLGNDLTCAVLISPWYVLASGSEFYSAEETPDKINFYPLNVCNDIEGEPFYIAKATDIYFFSEEGEDDWMNNIALIRLNRPFGATTGWMGYGYEDDSYYQSHTFYLTQIDESPEDQFNYKLEKYSATPNVTQVNGFFFAPYRVLVDGSAYYHNNIVHGVHAFTAWDNTGKYYDGVSRITQEKFNTISTIISANTPAQADLIPLKLAIKPEEISVSTPVDDIEFYLYNNSFSDFEGNVTIDIYLSTNNTISGNDIKLISYSVNLTVSAMASIYFAPDDKPQVPLYVPSATYILGAVITANDSNTDNNSTFTVDCDTLLVENIYATSYVFGRVNMTDQSSGNGYCMLLQCDDDGVTDFGYLAAVDEDHNFEFKNVLLGKYILMYLSPTGSNYVSTYYSQTPFWNDASNINLAISDTVRNIEIGAIEMSVLTGNKTVSGYLSHYSSKSVDIEEEDDFFDDVTVILQNLDDNTIISCCKPDNTGYYEFENIPSGNFDVFVDKVGYSLDTHHTFILEDESDGKENRDFYFYEDEKSVEAVVPTNVSLLAQEDEFSVYPNPVVNAFRIKTNNYKNKPITVELSNVLGEQIKVFNAYNEDYLFHVENLSSGVYCLTIRTPDDSFSTLFVLSKNEFIKS